MRNGSLGMLGTRVGVPAFSSLCNRLRGVDDSTRVDKHRILNLIVFTALQHMSIISFFAQ